ncbi:MAG TPA: hypothetical protein VFC86_07460 [Planctomycetota bacterium]|nr:hypothetical protein [Planctomycetota bacterium]
MHRSKVAIEWSLKVVNVIGILDQKHGNSQVMVNGKKEKRCSIVPGMTCDEHFGIADYAFLNGFPTSGGQLFVCYWNNNGKRPSKPVGNPGAEGYVEMVKEALAKIDGPTIPKPDYDTFMEQMDVAQRAREKKETAKAIGLYQKAAAKTAHPRLAALANEQLALVNEEGLAHVGEAERLSWENLQKAKDQLKQVIAKYPGLDCAKAAEDLLKRLIEKGKP